MFPAHVQKSNLLPKICAEIKSAAAFFEKEMEHDLSRDEVSKSPMMGDDVDQSDMSSNPHFVTLEETL